MEKGEESVSSSQKVNLKHEFILTITISTLLKISASEKSYPHQYYHSKSNVIIVSTGAIYSSSDSSSVHIEQICGGVLPMREMRGEGRMSRSQDSCRHLGSRGEERREVDIGEGTSRGPGELGSCFNPSNKQTKRNEQTSKQTSKQTNKQTKRRTKTKN